MYTDSLVTAVLLTHVDENTMFATEGGGNIGDNTSYHLCARLGSAGSDIAPQRPITASFSVIQGTATGENYRKFQRQ